MDKLRNTGFQDKVANNLFETQRGIFPSATLFQKLN